MEEMFVICLPYAIIEPSAMMIEIAHTSIACSTMLSIVLHKRFTHFAKKLQSRAIKRVALFFALSIFINYWISWIKFSCNISIVDHYYEND